MTVVETTINFPGLTACRWSFIWSLVLSIWIISYVFVQKNRKFQPTWALQNGQFASR